MNKSKIKVFGFEFEDFTEEYFKAIYFNPEEVWQKADYNRMKTMPTIIIGTTGSGKSTIQRFINKHLFDLYVKYGFCAVDGNDVKLSDFLINAIDVPNQFTEIWPKMPQVFSFFYDDATAKEPKTKEIQMFFSMRHLMEEKLGIKEGILYTAYATHDWFSTSKIFRRYGQLVIVLSIPPLDVYSRRHISKMLGEQAMKVLDTKYKLALKEDKYKGFGFVKLPYVPDGCATQVGLFKFDRVDFPSIQIMANDSMQTLANPKDLTLKIPQGETINESPEDALTREEHKLKLNRERVARFRERNKLVDDEPEPPLS